MRAHHLVSHRARQPRIGLQRLFVAALNRPAELDVQHLRKFCRRGRIGVSARRNGRAGTAACGQQKQRREYHEHLQGVNGQNRGLKATTNTLRKGAIQEGVVSEQLEDFMGDHKKDGCDHFAAQKPRCRVFTRSVVGEGDLVSVHKSSQRSHSGESPLVSFQD